MSGIEILDREPEEFFQGETIKWSKSLADYPFSAGWTLKYYYSSPTVAFNITAVQYGTTEDYLATILAADTTGKAAGSYDWQAWVSKGTETDMVATGQAQLKATLSGGGVVDTRSTVKQTLDALEALLLGKASKDQQETEIVGRKVKTMTPDELLKWRSQYKSDYESEQAAERVAQGLGTGRRVQTRFTG